MAEQNEETGDRIVDEVLNQGRLDQVDDYIDPNYVLHDPGVPGGEIGGLEGFKQFVQTLRNAFPDLHFDVHERIIDGDRIALRYTITGTHQGDFNQIPPTGKRVTITAISVNHFRGGKIAEVWNNSDTLGMLQQLGVIPAFAAG